MFNFNKDKNSNFATIKKAIIAIILFVFILILFMGCRNMVADGIISDAGELSRVRTDTRAKIIAESGIEVSVTDDYSYHFDGTGTLKTDEEDTSEISSGEDEDTVSDSSASYADNQTERSIEDTDAEENVSDNSLKLQQSYNYNYDTSAETEKKSKEPSGITQIIKKAADVVSGNSDKSSASTKTESKHSSATTTTTHKHQYRGIVTKKPSCTEDGIVTYTCAECNDTYTKIQKATGHNYVSEITKEPTCISEGIKTYTCSLCGDTYTEKISMSEHSYGEPYDGGDGYTYKKCSVCGDTVTVDTVNYSISYDTDGGALIDYVMSYTVDSNINLPVPTKNGYTFNGWEDENGNIITTTSNCVGDLELKALWSGNTTEISFVNNGEVIKTVSAIIGNVIGELPDLTETGKVFTGWFTSADGGVMVTEDYVINDEDLILYAVFDEEVETITITDSVTNESTTYTVIYGESIGEFTYTEHDGYTFTGFVDSEGNIVTEDTIVSSNMTITAEYEVISYDITYVLNGGSETTQNPASYTVNDSFYLVSPQKEGYYFTGWTGSNGDTPSKSVKIASGTTGELTYTANWSAKNVTYTVNHIIEQSDGSYVTESEVLYAPADSDVTPTVNSYNGYTSPEEQTVTVSANGSTTVDYTYEITEYSISYELNGGEFVTEYKSTYTIYDEVTLCSPERTGYDFVSWLDVNGYTFDGVIPKGTTGNLTYTASWEARVAYLSDGQYINYVIKAVTGMSGSKSKVLNASQTTITKIVRADKEDEDAFVIGLSDYTKTEYDVGAWYDADSGTLYWYSDAAKLVLDSDASYMFANMSALTSVDIVEYFDTSEATTFNYMFTGCTSLTSVDLSSFDTESCTSMTGMFNSCSALTTIYASDSFVTTGLSSSCTMFKNCTSLVGGNGTAYSSSNISSTYATIDTADLPGYFTN